MNSLVLVCDRTLAEVTRGMKGLAVMSAELEEMATALANNQVWKDHAQGLVKTPQVCKPRSVSQTLIPKPFTASKHVQDAYLKFAAISVC